MARRIITAREQVELLEPWRLAAAPSLADHWNHFTQWHGPGAKTGVQGWGTVETYLDDAHGLNPYPDVDAYFAHPTTVAMAKLHSMAQGKDFADGYGDIPDGDLQTGAALGLLKIRKQKHLRNITAAADDRHPDLLASLAACGCVHTQGGRRLDQRTAAADFTGPQDTTFNGFNDPAGWTYHKSFEPSQIARQGASAFAHAAGTQDPHDGSTDYLGTRRTPESLKAVAQNYDSLPMHDPAAIKHFDALKSDVLKQHDFMTNKLGIQTQITDHDPYSDVHGMLDDVNDNKRLQVLGTHVTGGHPYLDDDTNDKFRAVHDFFGHAATGRSFDRHGEQAAYLAHAQMFSPAARPALATETRGQNSSLVYNGGFQPQKTALLHPQFWSGSGPMHLSRAEDWTHDPYQKIATMDPRMHTAGAPVPCQNCGKAKNLHGYGHQFGPCPRPATTRWRAPNDYVSPNQQRRLEQDAYRQGSAQDWTHDPQTDSYTHPNGHVIRPSDEAPGYQLWAPTVSMTPGRGGLAKDRRPHPDLAAHMDYAEKTGAWYHNTDAELEPGTKLTPGGGPSKWQTLYDSSAPPDDPWYMGDRQNHVWMSDNPRPGAFGRNTYEVEPEGEPAPWKDEPGSFTAPSATIKERHMGRQILTAREQVDLLSPWRTAVDTHGMGEHAYHTEQSHPYGYEPTDADEAASHRVQEDDESGYNWGPEPRHAATFGEEAFDHIQKNPGGITMKRHPGDGPSSGYMVSRPGAEKKQDYATLSPRDIDDYHGDHSEIDTDPEANYGGWEQGREPHEGPGSDWYHDVSDNIDDSYDAARAAVDGKQIALFDNDKVDHQGHPLDDAYVNTTSLVNSGPASATGFTHARRHR